MGEWREVGGRAREGGVHGCRAGGWSCAGPPRRAHAKGQGVVAGLSARFPPRPLVGEERADAAPIAEVDGCDVRPQTGHAGGVDKDVAHRHPVLAMRAELGPDVGHTLLVVQLAVFDQHMRDRGGDALARRRSEEEGVWLHRCPGVLIGDSGPPRRPRRAPRGGRRPAGRSPLLRR